ncbi:MAG: haloalkane dehalogenase [Pseudomonadales bacterium]|jgi:haloalkane dehalogenase|nr:haloalkane dehalogenase [Pseudomonadales bacterium]MDP6471240.1 haloalkane dehalogenase [Pseudomonadales bacterium]MDP6825571.1 haloalkane dehalogenase [Pseudomonadales bacterium]MDP6972938.1 haloalkane dehalogenase [Pseudomonadales bacterium]|tara:strand:+ start:5768 stop:6796 length:1029 start_codon:yes stop_codon:yes gene_type:complete
MEYVRTDETRFENLPGYTFEAHYVEVPDTQGGTLRMHYVDEGEGDVVLCLHGQPSWSYLYRKMIPLLVQGGCRVIAPDFIGFGKSDKPTSRDDYTYANHVAWLTALLEALDLSGITLFCQDWGGLIGLRTAAENPERFARIVPANTGLPDAQGIADDQIAPVSERMRAYYESIPVPADEVEMSVAMAGDDTGMGFLHWVKFCAESEGFVPGRVLGASCGGALSADEVRAYDAPFPDENHKAGPRKFPTLVPIIPDNPAIPANRAAWAEFERWEKPVLTAYGDSDPVTAGAHVRFQERVPGARGQAHVTIEGAGHFLQEQAPEQLAQVVLGFIADTPRESRED